jgi:hypothetical protein
VDLDVVDVQSLAEARERERPLSDPVGPVQHTRLPSPPGSRLSACLCGQRVATGAIREGVRLSAEIESAPGNMVVVPSRPRAYNPDQADLEVVDVSILF